MTDSDRELRDNTGSFNNDSTGIEQDLSDIDYLTIKSVIVSTMIHPWRVRNLMMKPLWSDWNCT